MFKKLRHHSPFHNKYTCDNIEEIKLYNFYFDNILFWSIVLKQDNFGTSYLQDTTLV